MGKDLETVDGIQTFKGIPLDRFEFVQHARPVGIAQPEMILLREKEARYHEGLYHRSYTMIDGSVHSPATSDGDFSEYERGRILLDSEEPNSLDDQAAHGFQGNQ